MSEPAIKISNPPLPQAVPPASVVYGPLVSRRFGKSLGINILGGKDKMCSYKCHYCDLKHTSLRLSLMRSSNQFPAVEQIETELQQYLQSVDLLHPPFDVITVSGNGDATLHPEFLAITEKLVEIRNKYAPQVPLQILTHGAHADNKKVLAGLNLYDKCFVKLDAGNNETLKAVNDPLIRTSVSKLIFYFKKIKNIYIQSFFVRGNGDNTSNEQIEDWMEAIGLIRPQEIHILTINKSPANPATLPVEENFLHNVAAKVYRRTQIKGIVFTD